MKASQELVKSGHQSRSFTYCRRRGSVALPAGEPRDESSGPSGKLCTGSQDEAAPSPAANKPRPAAASTGQALPRAGKTANPLAAQGPASAPASASRTKPGKPVPAVGPQPPASTSKSQAAKDFAAASRCAMFSPPASADAPPSVSPQVS